MHSGRIPEAACVIAHGRHVSHPLRPPLLAKIAAARRDPQLVSHHTHRMILCTAAEAKDLESYFRHHAAFYAIRADGANVIRADSEDGDNERVCVEAADNAKRALALAGIAI